MKHLKIGSSVETEFLTGVVVEVVDGRRRTGWRPTTYYRVYVRSPKAAADTVQIIRLDEVRKGVV